MPGVLPYALHHRLLTLILGLGLVAVGIWSFQQLKLEAYPDISDTGVVVITVYPGNASEEVEQQVTIPIERALNNVPRVIGRRSRTIFGLSVVELTFADGTDDYFARQLVLEKLRDAALPDGVTPTLGPLSTGISEFYRYVIEAEGYDDRALRELQDWVIAPRLAQVEGVAEVVIFGGLVKQYQIEVDPLALEKYRLTIADVAQALETNNRNGGGARRQQRPAGDGGPRRRLDPGGAGRREHRAEDHRWRAGLVAGHQPSIDWRGASNGHFRLERSGGRRGGHRADAALGKPQRGAQRDP